MNDQFTDLYHHAWTCAEFENEYKEKPTYERRSVVALEIFGELIVRDICRYIDDSPTLSGKSIITTNIKNRYGVK